MRGCVVLRHRAYLGAEVAEDVRSPGGTKMPKGNARLDAARRAYREALESARTSPTAEAWARLLTAGKELSAAEDPRARGRRGRHVQPARPDPPDPGRAEPLEGLE
jgi:hypothetical protein